MWTLLLIFSSFVLAESTYSETEYPPPITTTITCMVPGPFEASKKRSLKDPHRVPIPEPILELQLIPHRNASECWELPSIVEKPPYFDINDTDAVAELRAILDAFLNASMQMREITSNTEFTIMRNPNTVYNIFLALYEVPPKFLAGLSTADAMLIGRYVSLAGIGQCMPMFQVKRRPAFYYPEYQIYGRCTGSECGLPMTNDHDFSQRCRPDIGGDNQIYIRALRWDCCHSFTVDQIWERMCGWRMVRFPVVHKCQCSCDPTDLL